MKTLPTICLLLCCLTEVSPSQTLLLRSCSISVGLKEMHGHYSNLRLSAITGDDEFGVKLLNKTLIKDVQDGQSCCLLRLVLHFYITRVFPSYLSSQPHNQSSSSSLANTFISIRKQILTCHCLCEQDTQKKVDSLHDAFNQLETSKAVLKAVGELDTVLQWLLLFDQKSLS